MAKKKDPAEVIGTIRRSIEVSTGHRGAATAERLGARRPDSLAARRERTRSPSVSRFPTSSGHAAQSADTPASTFVTLPVPSSRSTSATLRLDCRPCDGLGALHRGGWSADQRRCRVRRRRLRSRPIDLLWWCDALGAEVGPMVQPRSCPGLLVLLACMYAPRTVSAQVRGAQPKELSCRPSSGTTM